MDLGDFNPVRVLAGKGEIGKSGLGSALATLALDYATGGAYSGLELAGMVGGGTALASGSLQKGLMAGLSAYGTHELAGAAEKGISDTAAKSIDFGDIADANPTTPLTTGEQFKAGLSGLKTLPTADLLKYGAMAAAPVLMAQSKTGLPSNPTNPNAYIRPKTYDPVSHRYYDLPAVKAGDWGGQSIADYVNSQVAPAQAARGGLMAAYANGGMTQTGADGGMFNYAQMQPAVDLNPNSGVTPKNMAHGGRVENGVRRFDVAGDVSAAYQAGDMGAVNSLIADNHLTESAVQNMFPTFDMSTVNPNVSFFNPSTAPMSFPINGSEVLGGQRDALTKSGIASGTAENQILFPSYTNDQYAAFFADPKNAAVLQSPAGLAAAEAQYRANPNEVNTYLSGLAGKYVDPTATQKGSGTLGIYQNLMKENVTPAALAAAEKGVNSDWGKTGTYWNPDTLAKAYQVADKVLQFDPLTDNVTPSDKEWVAFMDKNNISTKDISIATGLSQNEVDNRYNAAKTSAPVITKTSTNTNTNTNTGVRTAAGPITDTVLSTTPNTNAPIGSSNPYGNVNNPGDITRNPDGTITVTSNTPGRPYGGFSGMDEVTNAFTTGGGHLGQVLKPTRTYTNSGGSGSALDYLNNKGTWAGTRTQPTAKVRNTYSNIASPSAAEKAMYAKYPKVWVNGAMVDNPYYGKGTDSSSTTTLPTDTTNYQAAANGGLLALAHGGMSDGHLGGYSDGGRLLRGPGDGVSDSIPATIAGKQPARLADGEFVVPARIVSEIGNGSTEAGARKLYAMMDRVQSARSKTVGKGKVAKNTRADKYLPA